MSEIRNALKNLSVLEVLGVIIGVILMIVLFCCMFGWVTMLLWNALMPVIFGLPVISFWQAVGLMILGSFIFGGAKVTINKTVNETSKPDREDE